MKQSRSIPWPRIFAEGTIIVASILLAFWIDAWWDGSLKSPDEDSIDDLSLISSPQMVQSLEALRVAIERVKYHSRNDQEFHTRIMTPFMIEHADMAQITARMKHRPGQPEFAIVPTDYGFGRRQQHGEMLASVAFQNLLIAKIERCLDLLEIGHPGVEQHLNSAIRMLQAELEAASVVR